MKKLLLGFWIFLSAITVIFTLIATIPEEMHQYTYFGIIYSIIFSIIVLVYGVSTIVSKNITNYEIF